MDDQNTTEILTLRPIAHIQTDFPEKFGAPRQSGRVPELRGRIVFEKEYALPEAFRRLEGYSHIWLLWGFSLEKSEGFSPTVRPPRLGGNKRVGVFATRSPNRPNPIGLSCVELMEITQGPNGTELVVGGADLVSGTPIYDVKPYLPSTDSRPEARGGFADGFTDYALKVDFPEELLRKIPEDKRAALLGILAEDPRPAYHEDGRAYGLSFAGLEISFVVNHGVLTVTSVNNEHKSF